MTDVQVPQINPEQLDAFGKMMFALYQTHITDRKAAEERWMQNLRQYRGIYDPEIKIPSDQSRAYPKLTRWKIIGTVARLMQMLFPQTEKNWGIKPSPMPDLSVAQLQEVLDKLVADKAQGGDPAQVVLADEEIEKAIVDFAKGKSERMSLKIDDDLQEMEFITLARKVVFSAALYNIGVLTGPLHVKKKARTWVRNQFTGRYEAVEVDKYKPLYEFMRVWDYYPDMTAQSLDKQDGTFERHILTRQQVQELADRPDFLADRINDWLRKHQEGNYKAQWWETVMRGEPKGDRTYATKEGRKYEAASYWGTVTGHNLRHAGVRIADADLGKSFQANVWTLEDTVIKARLAPLDDTKRHHVFVFEDDDLSLLGNGLADVLRDSQLAVCETARATLDNASVVGPMVEVNDDLLVPGQDTSIRKHKTWRREGEGAAAGYPAVRDISVNSHLNELSAVMQMFIDFADKESGLPPQSLGDVSGGGSEALRTQKNASMFLGAAALPIRDTVRNYDSFTISVITSLVKWNEKYDPNPSRDGDHDIIARGSTSLIAKEVLAGSLENFRAGVTPDEAPHLNVRGLLEARAKANDIPVEDVLLPKDVAEQNIKAQQEASQRTQQVTEAQIHAQVQELVTRAVKNIAAAHKDDASIENDAGRLLVEALASGDETRIKEQVANKPAPAKAAA